MLLPGLAAYKAGGEPAYQTKGNMRLRPFG